jgi:hypothetical protein
MLGAGPTMLLAPPDADGLPNPLSSGVVRITLGVVPVIPLGVDPVIPLGVDPVIPVLIGGRALLGTAPGV